MAESAALDLLMPGADFARRPKKAIILDIVDGRRIHFADLINVTMKALLTVLLSRTALITVFINFASIPIRIDNCLHGYISIYRFEISQARDKENTILFISLKAN